MTIDVTSTETAVINKAFDYLRDMTSHCRSSFNIELLDAWRYERAQTQQSVWAKALINREVLRAIETPHRYEPHELLEIRPGQRFAMLLGHYFAHRARENLPKLVEHLQASNAVYECAWKRWTDKNLPKRP